MKQFIAPLALAISLLGALLGAPSANAGTMDDHYSKVGQLNVLFPNNPTCQDIDMTNDWASYILNAEKWDTAGNLQEAYINQKLSFEIALENGSWGVSQEFYPDYSNPTQKSVWVYWRENSQMELGWYQGYGIEVGHSDLHVVPINCENTSVPTARPNYPFNSIAVSRSNGLIRNYFVNNAILNIPSDYDGDFVRDTDPNSQGGGAAIDEKPQIKMDSMLDWKASFSEQRFYSYDMPPFVCGDGFPPRMNIELWDKDVNSMILTEQVSSNSKLDYEFEKVYAVRTYEIVSWFSCTDGTAFVEPGASFYTFTITEKGTLGEEVVDVGVCMSQEYPFVTFDGCKAMIARVVNALSFGAVKTSGTSFNFNNQCRELGTVGDWMKLENKTVCPVVPESIRNIITPFITLAVGMMTLRFITRKTGSSL